MKTFSHISGIVAACLLAPVAGAQFGLPTVVQLPTEDFIYSWGGNVSVDDRERPDFTINGAELPFECKLTGSFRPSSRMNDFSNMREFERVLLQSIYFIQDATQILNDLDRDNQLDWAILDCVIPEASDTEDREQERVDKALERAERQRERRREREEREDD
jgi:hypothetical protein